MVILWIVVLIVGLVIYKLLTSLNKDQKELKLRSLEDKFWPLINELNVVVFGGDAIIFERDDRTTVMMIEHANQMIVFFYSTGSLSISWKMKLSLSNEVTYKKIYHNVRDLKPTEQIDIAKETLINAEEFFDNNSGYMEFYYKSLNKTGFKYKITKNTVYKFKSIISEGSFLNKESISDEDDSQEGFVDENYLTFKNRFIVDSISNTIIKKIDAIVKENELTRDFSTNMFILDAINNSIELAKQLIDNEVEVNLSDDEKETILSSIYKKVYENYFID